MRYLSLVFLAFFTISKGISQSKNDIIYLTDGTKEVNVKEIGQSSIKYTYPGEEVIYTINKFMVSKVEFESGRVEKFTSPLKPVKNILDVENVYTTFNPDEMLGLHNLGSLFSKATGVTTLSSINNVNNRALTKLKYEAVMLGANAVYIGNQYQRGNQYGNEYTPGNSTQTSYSGMAFSNESLDLDEIEQVLINQKITPFQKITLKRNGWSPNVSSISVINENAQRKFLNIDKITREEDGIYVTIRDLRTKSDQLKVIRYDDNSIVLMERDGNGITNYQMLTEKHQFVKNRIN